MVARAALDHRHAAEKSALRLRPLLAARALDALPLLLAAALRGHLSLAFLPRFPLLFQLALALLANALGVQLRVPAAARTVLPHLHAKKQQERE
jgi:hypothetical protein